jgi:NADH dehydrogenase FAD-containing subunit
VRGALSARGVALRENGFVRKGEIMKYVIIGSGVAGIAAIEAIRSVLPSPQGKGQGEGDAEIIMIGNDPYGFYSRPGLAYYLTGELHDKVLFPRTADDYRRMNFRYVKGTGCQDCARISHPGIGWRDFNIL